MDYDWKKQMMIQKTIESDEIEIARTPYAMEIDALRREEAAIIA